MQKLCPEDRYDFSLHIDLKIICADAAETAPTFPLEKLPEGIPREEVPWKIINRERAMQNAKGWLAWAGEWLNAATQHGWCLEDFTPEQIAVAKVMPAGELPSVMDWFPADGIAFHVRIAGGLVPVWPDTTGAWCVSGDADEEVSVRNLRC